jgi:endo-1,4-beta-xylanase
LTHGERLAQQRSSKNKPVTGHKHLNSLAQAKSKAEV